MSRSRKSLSGLSLSIVGALTLRFFAAQWVRAENIHPPLPRTLEEAQHWWDSTEEPAPFVAPKPTPAPAPEASRPPNAASEAVPERVEQGKARLLEGAGRLVQRMGLPLEVGGYDSALRPDEEYRIDVDETGKGTLVWSNAFWSSYFQKVDPNLDHHVYATYLVYVLLRAKADFDYARCFDAEHLAWNVQGEAEDLASSLRVLHQTLQIPNTSWRAFDGPMGKLDEDFRRSINPDGDPARTLQALVRYAVAALFERSADVYALERFGEVVGEAPTRQIERRVAQRERIQAWNFGRARGAMTLAERMAFRKWLARASYVKPVVARAAAPAETPTPYSAIP